jgi:hypothetical protein
MMMNIQYSSLYGTEFRNIHAVGIAEVTEDLAFIHLGTMSLTLNK